MMNKNERFKTNGTASKNESGHVLVDEVRGHLAYELIATLGNTSTNE